MVLARLWPILLICPTQVLLPPFSMLIFVPLEADLCGRHPPGSLTLWLQGLANREPWWVWEGGREGGERGQSAHFPGPFPARPHWVGCASWPKLASCSSQDTTPSLSRFCNFSFYWWRLLCPSSHSFHAAFTWINNPSRNFPNRSSRPASGWDPNVYHVSLLPVFPGNWQLNLEAWPDSE